MTIELELRPTLLVGVGGTGSRIADRIMKQVQANGVAATPAIRMLAIDTDEGDLSLLKDLAKEDRIQFSQPEYVRTTLERNIDIQTKWAYALNDPEMTETIKGKTLIEGAGQIRMLTRLALHDALLNYDMFASIENAISRLAVHGDASSYKGAVQIIMIGSLGGATGSGSFLQLALALRKAAENRGPQPIIRGTFLMPDIFIRSGRVKKDEWESLLSNGYASLKELNALTLRASLRELSADFVYEYAPGQFAGSGDLPFEEITFIDYEDTHGGSMGQNVDAYVDMAARSAYLNVFTPLGRKIASQSINRTKQQQESLAKGQVNVYSGIGVSAVEYPVESIKRYLSRRLVLENLKGDWTRLDVAFRAAVARHKKDLAAGTTAAEDPVRSVSFLRDMAQLAQEDPPSPFFRHTYDRLFPKIEDPATLTKTEKPRHLAYVNSLIDYITRQFWSDNEMKRIKARSPMDESAILESDSVVDTIRQEEYTLDRDFGELEANLVQRPTDILQNTLISADNAAQEEWAPHHLQTYVVREGLHPVAVRGFLYLVQREMEERLGKLNPRAAKKKLFRLADGFRSDEEMQAMGNEPNKRGTPGVLDQATKADGGGMMGSIFNRKKKAFAEDYVIYNSQSFTLMDRYASETIQEKVLSQALTEVGSLIRTFEGLFGEIGAIGDDLDKEIENEIATYETSGRVFSGSSYVYANRRCKENAWNRLSEVAAGLTIDVEVNRQLCEAVFVQHRTDRRERTKTSFTKLRELFHRSVVLGFGQTTVERDYSSIYEMNVIEAIRHQYDVETAAAEANGESLGLSRDQYTKRIVDRVSRQSSPYLTLNRSDADGTGVKFWAIHPDSRSAIRDDAEFIDLFQSESSGENAVVEPQFSPYSLVCANLRVNLQLQDFAKLGLAKGRTDYTSASTDGRMTAAYNATVERMLDPDRAGREGAEFTPHVDKTWHLPGVLPELHSGQGDVIAREKTRAYVVANVLNLLKYEVDDRHRMARITTHGHGIRNGIDEVIAESHDPWLVYKSMLKNVNAVRSALAVWNRKMEAHSADALSHPVYKTLIDPVSLSLLYAPAQVRNDAVKEREDAVHAMTVSWIELLQEVVECQESSKSPRARDSMVLDAIESVREAFFERAAEDGYSDEVIKTYRSVFARAFDSVFAV